MAKLHFQSKITLDSAYETVPGLWEFQFRLTDNEGVFLGTDARVGDIIVIDTSSFELGTLTRYIIDVIVSQGASLVTAIVSYDPTNNNDSVPDPGFSIGLDGFISRPSTNYKLLPVPSPTIQQLPDRFSVYLQNYNFVNIVDNIQGGGQPELPQVLNNATPTPTALGGIPAGTTFDSVPVEVVLRSLLYPYQAPTFSAFSISGQSTTLEVGATVTGANRTFAWTATNASNITANTVEIQNITGGTTSLAVGLANDGTEVLSFADVTRTTSTTHVWRIRATNTQTTVFTRDFTVTWQWRRFFGESVNTTLTENQIEALRVNGLVFGFAGNYSFNAGGYKWIAYPTVFGTATTFKDTSTNLDVPFEPPVIVSVTNAFGVVQDYHVHRTTNVLGGAITIAVS